MRNPVLKLSLQFRKALRVAAVLGCGGIMLGCLREQSGNEDDLPPMPCAGGQTLVTGRITEVANGCVAIQVDQVVNVGQPVIDSGGDVLLGTGVAAGDVIRARLGQVYSYSETFHVDDAIAGIAGSWEDVLNLELLRRNDDRVLIQRAGRQFESELADLSASDCEDRLRGDDQQNAVSISSDGAQVHAAAPSSGVPACGN